jgi:hypothetical protein
LDAGRGGQVLVLGHLDALVLELYGRVEPVDGVLLLAVHGPLDLINQRPVRAARDAVSAAVGLTEGEWNEVREALGEQGVHQELEVVIA